mmetsp:Transcript_3134/g.9543  ORF Transcript_3134/g.9543 Transcript_3134/m.9543 type:complete len:246 (-) Transcript_3134:1219-1956(-)
MRSKRSESDTRDSFDANVAMTRRHWAWLEAPRPPSWPTRPHARALHVSVSTESNTSATAKAPRVCRAMRTQCARCSASTLVRSTKALRPCLISRETACSTFGRVFSTSWQQRVNNSPNSGSCVRKNVDFPAPGSPTATTTTGRNEFRGKRVSGARRRCCFTGVGSGTVGGGGAASFVFFGRGGGSSSSSSRQQAGASSSAAAAMAMATSSSSSSTTSRALKWSVMALWPRGSGSVKLRATPQPRT